MFSSHRSAASAPVIGHSSIAGGVGARGWGARRRLRQAQDLSACPAGGSRPVTRRDPALGTKTDSEPESQRTVISGSSTAVTTPLRVTLPTFSDSTSTRSPTSTIMDLLWMVTETRPPQVSPRRRLHSTLVVVRPPWLWAIGSYEQRQCSSVPFRHVTAFDPPTPLP